MNDKEEENEDDNAYDFPYSGQVLLCASFIVDIFNFLMSFIVPKVISILTFIREMD